MSNAYLKNKEELLTLLGNKVEKHINGNKIDALKNFIDYFFSITPLSELAQYHQTDLEGATLSFWQLLVKRSLNNTVVKVFNPTFERNGWHSPHTIIFGLLVDMPFIIDSLRMRLNELDLVVHHIRNGVFGVKRDKLGNLKSIESVSSNKVTIEAFFYIEVSRQDGNKKIENLENALRETIADVDQVVSDYSPMVQKIKALSQNVTKYTNEREDVDEAAAFIDWLLNNHFTFLGYEDFVLDDSKNQLAANERLGLCQLGDVESINTELLAESKCTLAFSKSSVRATVHRPAYPDYILVKKFNDSGQLIYIVRIMGLYTSPVYHKTPASIPYLRCKLEAVSKRSGMLSTSHHGKALTQIIEVFPRDELFLMDEEQLFNTAMGILSVQERHQIKVFIRRDPLSVFASVLVFVPRDTYSTELRRQIRKILYKRLNVEESEFTTYFSESSLARVHFIMRLANVSCELGESEAIAEEIIEVSRSWQDSLTYTLHEKYGEAEGERFATLLGDGFSASYREAFSSETGVVDCDYLSRLSDKNQLEMSFYCHQDQDNLLHFKVFHYGHPLPLATLIPLMENLGLRVEGSYPYKVKSSKKETFWIHDFSLCYTPDVSVEDLSAVEAQFKESFKQIWYGCAENGRFNRLVLSAGLTWREVSLIRAYARYLKQIHLGFSQRYIADTLIKNIDLTKSIMVLFETRFNSDMSLTLVQRKAKLQQIQQKLLDQLEQVAVLSEDQIIRQLINVINATLRTSFYQKENGLHKETIAFKIASSEVPGMPLPVPMYEIFVYSPRIEGIHLRGGKIARGGLRWSDRVEDFRTEVLGLVKAQQVKNAVIVPVGAKGGFVAKKLLGSESRDEMMEEGIACYKAFIRSLLDLTDNLENDEVIPPEQLIRYDEDDFYLVVAADKGTATFSDIANGIAGEYNFWLGDAFASGGSVGYDHKKMGITARGAWVSVQRHFREQGINCQETPFTVVGIGDMSGDVFGNGLLLSPVTSLVAAFNHQHIFIDPNPDIKTSFEERKRLFNLPRSSWNDYNQTIISEGGGVFSRAAKSIKITLAMKKVFDIKQDKLSPVELISVLLRSSVDLLWNGGIGTYIKASFEQHAEVGDKANDNLRIDGKALRCKIVGEGGNLGLTQHGRVEFALNGGALNTDFIDNSAGVDCSDHEVNIKILLNEQVAQGDMTIKQRDRLLESMTESVSQLVLKNNYRQIQALALAELECQDKMEEYKRFIHFLESQGKLKRKVECLPSDDVIDDRIHQGKGLTRPELSVLISYSKLSLKEKLLSHDTALDAHIVKEGMTAFPKELKKDHQAGITGHRLCKEIAVTQIANYLINMMGITFVSKQQQSTSSSAEEIVNAFVVARDVFQIDRYWCEIEQLDYQVAAELQHEMMADLMCLMKRTTRWLLRVEVSGENITSRISYFEPKVSRLLTAMDTLLVGHSLERWQARKEELVTKGVKEDVAKFVAAARQLHSMLYIIQAAEQTGASIERAAGLFMALGEKLEVHWFYHELNAMKALNHWQSMARESIRDELGFQQRSFAVALLGLKQSPQNPIACVDYWASENKQQLDRWQSMMMELKASATSDLALYTVMIREIMGMAQNCMKMQ